ncbi:uncharacterized protein LOC124955966 isoform X2 [Vespa velutina]|uniref:uncharacterized protein LOC124955966 isoform X2 n=1 Tax=Vespa velutina TaxID=202808 RepID=UPI001FB4359D|nr:uncharacterized protein LOC124955966 isoform X2 [Vespa velutina]
MLSVVIKRTITRLDLRNLYVSVAYNNYILGMKGYQSKELILPSITSKRNIIYRNFSQNEKNKRKIVLPQLIPGPTYITQSFFNFIKIQWYEIFIPFIIKDTDFNIKDIMESAKKAASMVSIALSNKDYDSLENLVDDYVLDILKLKVNTLTEEERKLIAMTEENILLCLPYNINFLIESEEKKTVELEFIIHYSPDINIKEEIKNQKFIHFIKNGHKCVSNYIFKRDYIQDRNTYWIIKHLNHFEIYSELI